MVAFVDILEEVETRAAAANRPFAPPQLGLTEVCCAPATIATETAQAESAYRNFQRDPRPKPRVEAPDEAPPNGPEQFAMLLSGACGSAPELKALRRRLAWRLHPDRRATDDVADTLSLSEINAAIDAALGASRNVVNGRRR